MDLSGLLSWRRRTPDESLAVLVKKELRALIAHTSSSANGSADLKEWAEALWARVRHLESIGSRPNGDLSSKVGFWTTPEFVKAELLPEARTRMRAISGTVLRRLPAEDRSAIATVFDGPRFSAPFAVCCRNCTKVYTPLKDALIVTWQSVKEDFRFSTSAENSPEESPDLIGAIPRDALKQKLKDQFVWLGQVQRINQLMRRPQGRSWSCEACQTVNSYEHTRYWGQRWQG